MGWSRVVSYRERSALIVRYVSAIKLPIGLLLSGGTFLMDTMSSQIFWIMVGGFLYSEFVIGSSRFLYPIKITETPAENSKNRKK
jgi:hypothetical protein